MEKILIAINFLLIILSKKEKIIKKNISLLNFLIFNDFLELIIILKMINQKKNPENSERIFNISYTCKYGQTLSIKTQKKREKKLKNRRQNSLSELTKKFLRILLEEKKNKKDKKDIIDLKEIIPKINVKKRRIYDITNVLQGK
jgi:hypothetical protein